MQTNSELLKPKTWAMGSQKCPTDYLILKKKKNIKQIDLDIDLLFCILQTSLGEKILWNKVKNQSMFQNKSHWCPKCYFLC